MLPAGTRGLIYVDIALGEKFLVAAAQNFHRGYAHIGK
jgi:hypothetical protein